QQDITAAAGETFEVSAGIAEPSKLPPNARIAIEWAGYRKVLHALDSDFHMAWRAPKAGKYTLRAAIVTDEEAIFNQPRWRESGSAQKVNPFPKHTPWPQGQSAQIWLSVKPFSPGASTRGMILELEPNNSISEAQPVRIGASGEDETLHITGGA